VRPVDPRFSIPDRLVIRLLLGEGAIFVTPSIDRGTEIRCYMRDPDGYRIEVGQSTGLLHGKLAAKRPEDLPG
jgi:hypothetical protein